MGRAGSYTESDTIVTSTGSVKSVSDIGTGGGGSSNQVVSDPPIGNFMVTNLYVNTQGKLVVKWDDTGGTGGFIPTTPPDGNYKVVNLYVNNQGKLIVKYDDVPV